MDRPPVTADQPNGTANGANFQANAPRGHARYPEKLLPRVSTVTLETLRIGRGLPALERP